MIQENINLLIGHLVPAFMTKIRLVIIAYLNWPFRVILHLFKCIIFSVNLVVSKCQLELELFAFWMFKVCFLNDQTLFYFCKISLIFFQYYYLTYKIYLDLKLEISSDWNEIFHFLIYRFHFGRLGIFRWLGLIWRILVENWSLFSEIIK